MMRARTSRIRAGCAGHLARTGIRTGTTLLIVAGAACELSEITLAEADDVIVAEVVLRAGEEPQLAFLHRTLTAGRGAVPGAVIEVRNATGAVMRFEPAPAAQCLDGDDAEVTETLGSCYRSLRGAVAVRPAGSYSLRIALPDGRVILGETVVPGDFELVRPAVPVCRLAADSTFELKWTRSAGAWVYVAETRLTGIRAALKARDVRLDRDPIRLLGLGVSNRDTTLVFPTQFGIFDRADPAFADALLAIRAGLPPDVVAEVSVAAADRNYVNWVRGGRFNPSGEVRVSSLRGDGTGAFGSLVPKSALLATSTAQGAPSCSS